MPPASSNTTTPSVHPANGLAEFRLHVLFAPLACYGIRALDSQGKELRARKLQSAALDRRCRPSIPLRISAAPARNLPRRIAASGSRAPTPRTKKFNETRSGLPARAPGADPSWERIFLAARLIPFTKPAAVHEHHRLLAGLQHECATSPSRAPPTGGFLRQHWVAQQRRLLQTLQGFQDLCGRGKARQQDPARRTFMASGIATIREMLRASGSAPAPLVSLRFRLPSARTFRGAPAPRCAPRRNLRSTRNPQTLLARSSRRGPPPVARFFALRSSAKIAPTPSGGSGSCRFHKLRRISSAPVFRKQGVHPKN